MRTGHPEPLLAKDLLFVSHDEKQILRFAQNDKQKQILRFAQNDKQKQILRCAQNDS